MSLSIRSASSPRRGQRPRAPWRSSLAVVERLLENRRRNPRRPERELSLQCQRCSRLVLPPNRGAGRGCCWRALGDELKVSEDAAERRLEAKNWGKNEGQRGGKTRRE